MASNDEYKHMVVQVRTKDGGIHKYQFELKISREADTAEVKEIIRQRAARYIEIWSAELGEKGEIKNESPWSALA